MAYDCWQWEWTKTWHYTRTVVRDHLGYTDEESRRLAIGELLHRPNSKAHLF